MLRKDDFEFRDKTSSHKRKAQKDENQNKKKRPLEAPCSNRQNILEAYKKYIKKPKVKLSYYYIPENIKKLLDEFGSVSKIAEHLKISPTGLNTQCHKIYGLNMAQVAAAMDILPPDAASTLEKHSNVNKELNFTLDYIFEKWNELQKQLINNPLILNEEQEKLFSKIEHASNHLPAVYPTVFIKKHVEKSQNKFAKFNWPLTNKKSAPIFVEKVLPGQLPLDQFASTLALPRRVRPFSFYKNIVYKDNKFGFRAEKHYLFNRSSYFSDRKTRADFIKQYIQPLDDSDSKEIYKAVFLLYSHAISQIIYEHHTRTHTNHIAVITYILQDIEKTADLILSELSRSILIQELSNLLRLPNKKPIDHPEDKHFENVREAKNDVKKMWINKKCKWDKNKKLDEIDESYLQVKEDINVYNKDTGELIFAYRKENLPQTVIDKANPTFFSMTEKALYDSGASRFGDEINPKLGLAKKARRCAPVNILGNDRVKPCLTTLTRLHDQPDNLLEACGEITKAAEAIYNEVAPVEYAYNKKHMKSYKELLLPHSNVTMTMEINYDKQTLTHTDANQLNGKKLAFLTCLYGDKERHYTGGFLVWPEYKLYIDVEQGDIIVGDFENNIHCNTKIIPLDSPEWTMTWHRVSAIGFTLNQALNKTKKFSIETSDDEVDIDQRFIQETNLDSEIEINHPTFLDYFRKAKEQASARGNLMKNKNHHRLFKSTKSASLSDSDSPSNYQKPGFK